MAFFKGFIDTAKAPPPWLRMVNKRGTFFLPLDPRRTPSASLPKLLKRCNTTFIRLLVHGELSPDLITEGIVLAAPT